MASSLSFAEFVRELLAPLGTIRTKKMFGEYGVYCDGVFFALICDDTLYFQGDEVLLQKFPTANHPFPGAKLWGVADADMLEDRRMLISLARESWNYKVMLLQNKNRNKKHIL